MTRCVYQAMMEEPFHIMLYCLCIQAIHHTAKLFVLLDDARMLFVKAWVTSLQALKQSQTAFSQRGKPTNLTVMETESSMTSFCSLF